MVHAIFNKEKNILETQFKDDVHLNEIIDYIITTKENKSYPRTLKILTNAQDAVFKFTINDLNAILSENVESLKNYEAIIDAIIIASPQTAALSLLYQELAKSKQYHFDVFSTHEAALHWLKTF
ncbi:hypothetical protein [Yeosuana sp. AK3]